MCSSDLINGRKANIASMLVGLGDTIQVKPGSVESPKFQEIKANGAYKTPPEWLEVDIDNLTGRVLALPTRENVDLTVNEQLIVELYSR